MCTMSKTHFCEVGDIRVASFEMYEALSIFLLCLDIIMIPLWLSNMFLSDEHGLLSVCNLYITKDGFGNFNTN